MCQTFSLDNGGKDPSKVYVKTTVYSRSVVSSWDRRDYYTCNELTIWLNRQASKII